MIDLRPSGRERILKALDAQERVEGSSEDLELLRGVVRVCQWDSEWRTLTHVERRRTGPLSYQVQRFYRPSPLLYGLRDLFQNED